MWMKINIKVRLRNKAFVISMVALVVSFVNKVISLFDIVPSVSEVQILDAADFFINILAFLGVLVDPTTKGVSDSDRAMTYLNEGVVNE